MRFHGRAGARACAWVAIAIGIVAAALAALAGFGERLDTLAYDAQIRLVRAVRNPSVPPQPDIVLVGIDDASLAATGEPLPLSLIHAQLGAALSAIASAQPRLTAVDIALPEASVESLRPGYDTALLRGIVAVRNNSGVVLVITPDQNGVLRPPFQPYLAAAGADAFGTARYPTDHDNVVRRYDPALAAQNMFRTGQTLPSFLTLVARKLGVEDKLKQGGWIDFTRGAPFDYVPLSQVVAWQRAGDMHSLQRAFAGKVVFVGGVLPYTDRYPQPYPLVRWEHASVLPPGVILHAQATRSLLYGGLIHAVPMTATLALIASMLLLALQSTIFRRWLIFLLVAAAVFFFSTFLHAQGWRLPIGLAILAGFVALTARSAGDVLLDRRERLRLARTFGGYVSPQLLQAILSGRIRTGYGRRAMAFMFADLRGFTSWSERAAPEETLDVLNRYYAAITPAIHRHGGTIDNFRGDGIMVMFGAPEPLSDTCAQAFAAARELLATVAQLNRDELQARGVALEVSIGLAYGEAVYGDLGSPDRKDFTALGDAVNVAARLQDLAKTLGYPVLMTMDFVAQLQQAAEQNNELTPEPLGEAPLKGHSPVAVAGWRPLMASAT